MLWMMDGGGRLSRVKEWLAQAKLNELKKLSPEELIALLGKCNIKICPQNTVEKLVAALIPKLSAKEVKELGPRSSLISPAKW